MFLRNYRFKLKELEQDVNIKKQNLELEYKFKKHALDASLIEYEKKIQQEIVKLAEQCAKDTGAYEHVYHLGIQEKQAQLAELDAKIATRTETANNDKVVYERLLKSKEEENMRLAIIIKELTEKLGKSEGDKTIINR